MSEEKPKKKADSELTMLEVLAIGLHGFVEDLGMLHDDVVRTSRDQAPAWGEDAWSASSIRFRKLLEDRGIL